jgi:hypothetical protein
MRGSITILCHLALAVVLGILQYLVPATHNAIGASFLHHVYRNIHNETLENLITFRISSTQDLIWELWQRLISAGGKRLCRLV